MKKIYKDNDLDNKIFPKKSLGQNFLKSEKALNTIIETSQAKKGDIVLEIGPGQGALTEKILATGANVIGIEKDEDLIAFLNEKFLVEIESGQFTLINKDILEFDEGSLPNKYSLIANIPYYITGQIIRKFLSSNNQPQLAVLLVQKEVAERIISKPEKNGSDKHPKNKENLLSLSVKAYSNPKYVETVLAGSFSPAPKVDSAIILLNNISKKYFVDLTNLVDGKISNLKTKNIEDAFFNILHLGFAHKRKTLLKNLRCSELFKDNDINEEILHDFLKEKNLNIKIRAEDLNLENWLCLTKLVLDKKLL